jgi:DNA-binding NarL/FixJ family response regulator
VSEAIRVIIADDHPVFRSGLRTLVQESPALELVAEAADGDEVISLCHRHHPDVVLMDIRMHPFPSLSSRERDILDLLAAGLANATIADRLALSEKTVRNSLEHPHQTRRHRPCRGHRPGQKGRTRRLEPRRSATRPRSTRSR